MVLKMVMGFELREGVIGNELLTIVVILQQYIF